MTAPTGTVTLHRVLRAPPERVYRAFLDPDAMAKWLPPHGFTGRVLSLDARVGGNAVTELLNGDQIFPPMLAAIQGAKKSITFETYIYWSGDIGKQFADALSERARAGVRVHVLLDWVGSAKMDESYLTEMKEAGCRSKNSTNPTGTTWPA